jgi:hypothetical protein
VDVLVAVSTWMNVARTTVTYLLEWTAMEKMVTICGRLLHALQTCTTHPSFTALRRRLDVDGSKSFLLLLRIPAKYLLVAFSRKRLGTFFQLLCHRRTIPFNILLLTRQNGVRHQRQLKRVLLFK